MHADGRSGNGQAHREAARQVLQQRSVGPDHEPHEQERPADRDDRPPVKEHAVRTHTGFDNDQPRDDDIGQHAGWGAGEDLDAPPVEERTGPALAPFLRYRGGARAWRLALGCLWLPAIVVVITVEDWLHVPQSVQWISLGVVFVVFNLVAFVPDSRRR